MKASTLFAITIVALVLFAGEAAAFGGVHLAGHILETIRGAQSSSGGGRAW